MKPIPDSNVDDELNYQFCLILDLIPPDMTYGEFRKLLEKWQSLGLHGLPPKSFPPA